MAACATLVNNCFFCCNICMLENYICTTLHVSYEIPLEGGPALLMHYRMGFCIKPCRNDPIATNASGRAFLQKESLVTRRNGWVLLTVLQFAGHIRNTVHVIGLPSTPLNILSNVKDITVVVTVLYSRSIGLPRLG